MSDTVQTRYESLLKFASRCVHCGKPMAKMAIDTFDHEPGPLRAMFKREVFVMWIDPEHECNYLTIAPKEPSAKGEKG